MLCTIYKSRVRQDTYLYVATRNDFSRVPESLLRMLGEPVHVMDLELTPQRRLAREDVGVVIQSLAEQGWYLQMPRREEWQRVH